jgi:hypothetical protein
MAARARVLLSLSCRRGGGGLDAISPLDFRRTVKIVQGGSSRKESVGLGVGIMWDWDRDRWKESHGLALGPGPWADV